MKDWGGLWGINLRYLGNRLSERSAILSSACQELTQATLESNLLENSQGDDLSIIKFCIYLESAATIFHFWDNQEMHREQKDYFCRGRRDFDQVITVFKLISSLSTQQGKEKMR